jgi:hypothetical protein
MSLTNVGNITGNYNVSTLSGNNVQIRWRSRPDTRWVSGALGRGYPGHRSTRRPVPAEDWNENEP